MPRVSGQKRAVLLPILTAVLAAGIFAADTATNLEIAVPVLYVAVVLIAVRFCDRRGVILIAAGCIGLTILSSIFTATDIRQTGLIKTADRSLDVGPSPLLTR